jgi:hypothetical protein
MSKSKEKNECGICISKKSNFIECQYCHFAACNDCQQTYILEQPQPKCMSCGKEWTYNWVRENFFKNFINGSYKDHKSNILYEIEKVLLPNEQEIAKKCKKYYNEIHSLKNDLLNIEEKIYQEYKKDPNAYKKSSNILLFNRTSTNKKIKDSKKEIEWITNNAHYLEDKKQEPKFRRICPVENCRGFFDDKSWKCGLCNGKVCNHCLEEKTDEHKCDPDIIKNVKSMLKETKPCPTCAASIFKIEGCSQMFCTICHTAFDWITGRIENGRIHNPHYWEYLKQTGRDLEEVKEIENGGVGRLGVYRCFTFEDCELKLRNSKRFNSVFQKIYHLQEVELLRFQPQDLEIINKDIRIQYLCNCFSEKEFKSKLMARFKRNNFNNEMYQILEMFLTTSKDIISTTFKDIDIIQIEDLDTFTVYKSLRNLQDYTFKAVHKIYDIYEYTLPNFDFFQKNFYEMFLPKPPKAALELYKEYKAEEYAKKFNGYNWYRDSQGFFYLEWNILNPEEKEIYEFLSKEEKTRYKKEMKEIDKFNEEMN